MSPDNRDLIAALSYMIGAHEGYGHRVPAWVHNARSEALRNVVVDANTDGYSCRMLLLDACERSETA